MMFGKYRKRYEKPRKAYDKARIEEENALVEKYGLKNKREIWRADAAIAIFRKRAKELIGKNLEVQEGFLRRLKKLGFEVEKIADVLALEKEDYLKRRLQSIVAAKKLAASPKQARQFIVHKHVVVGDHVVNIPSYLVPTEEEQKILLRKKNGS